MASNIDQLVNFENPLTINVKNTAHEDRTHQRKMALGDIKNAPSAIEKPSVKINDVKISMDESMEGERASSKYVDYFNVWTNELALSDAEVNRWMTMLNVARTKNWEGEERTPPPSPPPPFFEEEIPLLVPDDSFETLEAPPLLETSSDPESPASDSSTYYSFDDSSFEFEL